MAYLDLLNPYLKSVSRRHKSRLKVAHINAQSLNDSVHFDEFKQAFCDSAFDIVAVCETFFSESSNVDIESYQVFNVNRKNRNGGGVAVYISDRLVAKVLVTSDGDPFQPEFILLEVQCLSNKILFACVYRPPKVGHMDTFVNAMSQLLPLYKYAMVCGDLNAGFGRKDFYSGNVEECLALCNLIPIPFEPTYHTLSCDSTLDVIASNFDDMIYEYGQTPAPEFSNHDLIYAIIDLKVSKPEKQFISFRDYKNIDVQSLTSEARLLSWDEVYKSVTIDDKVSSFNQIVTNLMDKHAPIRTVAIKKPNPPWFTGELLQMISLRNRAREKFLSTKDPCHYETFRVLRNNTKQAIKNAKVRYFHGIFTNSKSSKEIWSHIRSLSGDKSKKCMTTPSFTANELNQHYLKVSTVASENTVHKTILNYVSCSNNKCEPFYFKYVTPFDIIDAISSIRSKAEGEDHISIVFLKLCLVEFLPVLEHLFNFCLQHGVFPSLWKTANVIPIPKISNPVMCKDYRPVSILCVLSKVLEKVVHTQVSEFLTKNKLLNVLQSGFRPGHSTKTTLLKVTDDIRLAIDQRKLVLAVLLDFSKAFDKVHHGLLLAKLKKLGFANSAINWFYAYLSDRTQRVLSGKDFVSEWDFIETGVPQGSVLGPLLFLLYINDISDVLCHCSYHIYADDLQIYLYFDPMCLDHAVALVNSDLNNILVFAKSHNLSLNVEKTQPIIFGSSYYLTQLRRGSLTEVQIDGVKVPYRDTVCNLGVIFDPALSWTPQCINIVQTVFRSLAMLRRNFCYMPRSIRKIAVESIIFPIFDYAAVLLTDISVTNSIKLQRAQNACIRFIVSIPKFEHVSFYYEELGILKLDKRRDLALAVLLWNIFKYQSPSYIHSMFTFISEHTKREGRQPKQTLVIPQHRTSTYNHSFCVSSCRIWNKYQIYSFLSHAQPASLKHFVRSILNSTA